MIPKEMKYDFHNSEVRGDVLTVTLARRLFEFISNKFILSTRLKAYLKESIHYK